MPNYVDQSYFEELSRKDPEGVCRRALCTYDPAAKGYMLPVWDETVRIYPQRSEILRNGKDVSKTDSYLGLLIVWYLLHAKEIEPAGHWISEKEIPGGATFFRGPHAMPAGLVSNKYGDDPKGFRSRCQAIHGTPLDMADQAFCFGFTRRIPVAVLLWKGDDEFPAEAKLLFDRTISLHLSPDIVFALGTEVCKKVGQ